MERKVKDLRTARREATEARLLDAATELFIEHGYDATTLTAVAERAGLAPRTVYVRFGGKAKLLLRCIDVAIAGDAEPGPIAERPWMLDAFTAPTLSERLERMASITTALMERSGPLLAVAHQAAGTEPEIAAAAQAGREDTRRTMLEFWRHAFSDGLLPDRCDLVWLGETATLLAHADTYVLVARTTRWDIDTYRQWLEATWTRLVDASAAPTPPRHP